MKLLLSLLFFLLSYSVIAQNEVFEKAEKHFKNFEFEQAIILYKQVIEKDSNDFNVQIRLAEAYRKTNQFEKAAYWYSLVVKQKDVKPIYLLYYGKMLLEQGECEAANHWHQKYIDKTPDEFHHFRHPMNCDWWRFKNISQEDSTTFLIKKLSIANVINDKIGLNYYNNTLLFTEKSKFIPPVRYDSWHTPAYQFTNYELLIDTVDLAQNLFDYKREPIKCKPLPAIYNKYNDSDFSLTKKGNTYFVRHQDWVREDTIVLNSKIFYFFQKKHQSKEVIGLPFNSDEYNVCSPHWVSEKAVLYFASDMPGGFGGYDLYYSEWEDGMFGPPINLGPSVNTEFDEINPFLNETNQRLYFASNNKKSLGGYDIFYSKISEATYSKYIHLSTPINSKADDLNFICNENGTHGYFISDRIGKAFKLDIYEFLKKEK